MEVSELDKKIELIKQKVLYKDQKLSKDEELILKEVYFEITEIATKKGKVLNTCCGNILIAYKIVQNYITYHQPKIKSVPEIEMVKVEDQKTEPIVIGQPTNKQLIKLLQDKKIPIPKNPSKKTLLELYSKI